MHWRRTGGAQLPDDVDETFLDRVEPILEAADIARTELCSVEEEKRHLADASRVADDADDFDERERLLSLRRENHTARKRLREETDAALRALADLVRDPSPTPADTANVDPAPRSDPAYLPNSGEAALTTDPEASQAVASEITEPEIPVSETGRDAPPEPGAPATDAGDDETPARWGGRTLDETLCLYLDQGESALACHLTRLAEDREQPPALPSAVLRALVLAPGSPPRGHGQPGLPRRANSRLMLLSCVMADLRHNMSKILLARITRSGE